MPPMIQVSWRVQGGSKTRVELAPAPGTVPLVGAIAVPLTPGSTTFALQVKLPTGEALTRSVTVEVVAPPNAAGATPETAPGTASSPAVPPAFGAPAPATGDRLAPSEQPPQFTPGR